MVTETNGEMVKYRNRSQAQFLPVEIYNDEKRQYIIEQLTNINCPFVEEDTTIYVPDYYEKSVLKAAAAFKPMNNQTVRDRLKFYIDRLIYSANSFDELLCWKSKATQSSGTSTPQLSRRMRKDFCDCVLWAGTTPRLLLKRE